MKTYPRFELLPPGEYYIGDPCHIGIEWNFDHRSKIYGTKKDGPQYWVGSTAHGDGVYPIYKFNGEKKHRLIGTVAVDVGMISIVPTKLVDQDHLKEAENRCKAVKMIGKVIKMKTPFYVWHNRGDITWGEDSNNYYSINTRFFD